ncbi:MATE family efflux transporter [Halegenticoccus tardaugens]|uniref:MATE family efflux transporter n=1 Tax=Halegenticoccus tardaugens TaxID=2071624 RepID=UPI00100B866A|nr:MATE family efflux transporter [Halegenticoccus tardaugens]
MSVRDRLESILQPNEEIDLTSGEIARPMLYLSLPIVVTNLLQTAYNLADTFWLGQYSTEALAAISFAFPMVYLLISLAVGLSVAGSVLVAQHVGAGNDRHARYAASQTIALATLVSGALGVVGFLFAADFVDLLGASPDIAPLATGYMRVYSPGLVFVFGFAMFIALMRGYGDTVTPMLVMLGSVVLNIALDPFLIMGWGPFPELGIEGAAAATIVSRAAAFVVGLWIMFRGTRGVTISLREMRPNLSYYRTLFRIGVPASIEGTGRALSINLLLVIVAAFPTTVVAAYGIGTRVFSVIFLPAIAFSQGVETMTGQNVGAGNLDRVAETNGFASRVMFLLLAATGVAIWLAARPISAAFTTDPAVVEASVTFLEYVAPTFGFIGVMYAYTGGFRGVGMTAVAAAISIAMLGVVRLPVAWVATSSLGSAGIWIAFAVSNVAGGVIAYLWFRRGTWRDVDATGVRTGSAVAGDD